MIIEVRTSPMCKYCRICHKELELCKNSYCRAVARFPCLAAEEDSSVQSVGGLELLLMRIGLAQPELNRVR